MIPWERVQAAVDLIGERRVVVEVRCPHTTGLSYIICDPPSLCRLPCPCNEASDIVRIFAEVDHEETKP